MDNEFQVQTRSESTGLRHFPDLGSALISAIDDATIWKISFSLPTGERVRLIRDTSQERRIRWVYDPIEVVVLDKM